MKPITWLGVTITLLAACTNTSRDKSLKDQHLIVGTWQLFSGITIENKDTIVTDYTQQQSFVKIINDTHFAFLNHDLHKGKDSGASFTAGGGRYSLKDSLYTEHLEYCSDRQWEENDFTFVLQLSNDTLIQTGVEQVKDAGINRLNIEKYKRLRK